MCVCVYGEQRLFTARRACFDNFTSQSATRRNQSKVRERLIQLFIERSFACSTKFIYWHSATNRFVVKIHVFCLPNSLFSRFVFVNRTKINSFIRAPIACLLLILLLFSQQNKHIKFRLEKHASFGGSGHKAVINFCLLTTCRLFRYIYLQ